MRRTVLISLIRAMALAVSQGSPWTSLPQTRADPGDLLQKNFSTKKNKLLSLSLILAAVATKFKDSTKILLLVFISILGCLFVVSRAEAAYWHEHTKLIASQGQPEDFFGYSVSISGHYAIVGTHNGDGHYLDSGSAYIFERSQIWGEDQIWEEKDRLFASDGFIDDCFGRSVSISGDYAIVGVFKDDDKGEDSGSAYIFKRDWDESWTQQQPKLLPSDVVASYDYFGVSVSISGDYAIVGAHGDDDKGTDSGSAYIFKRDLRTDFWTLQQPKLLASDGDDHDIFGKSVSISGDYAIVGAAFDENDGLPYSGSAYIFQRDLTTNSWTQQAKLTASDGAAQDFFGKSVSISGDYAIVGAYHDSDNGTDSGSAYIFKRDLTTNSWTQQAKLLASDGDVGDNFGVSVSISGDYAIVGAQGDDDKGTDSGSIYVFEKPASGWVSTIETVKLTTTDGSAGDFFGDSVSISGDYAIAGAHLHDGISSNTGSAYVVKRFLLDDDDREFEFGIEWINDYEGDDNDLERADDEAQPLAEVLENEGWTKEFEKSNAKAKCKHWSEEENDYVDKVDLALFAGHGSKSYDSKFNKRLHGPRFRKPAWYKIGVDYHLTPGKAYDKYGDKDVEWIAFSCCQALRDNNGAYWSTAFNGAHLILGFETIADTGVARSWARRMTGQQMYPPAKRVVYAWFQAVDDTQEDGTVARVIGEDWWMMWDHIWGRGAGPQPDFEDDEYYYFWDHRRGEPINQVPKSSFNVSTSSPVTSMTLYEVVPKSINETYVSQLGAKLGISSGDVFYEDGIYYMAEGTKYLEVSQAEGISYGDTSKLWVPWDPSKAKPILPGFDEAEAAATAFLSLLSDQEFLPPDTLDALADPVAQNDVVQSRALRETGEVDEEVPLDIQVSFDREITGGYPVVGAGSSLLVYYDRSLVDYPLDNTPIGLSIIWREITPAGSVDIFTEDTARERLNTYGSKVTLGGIPYHDELNINQVFLGYYEEGFDVQQTSLIPVYIFYVDFIVEGTVDSSGFIYVPAADEFISPVAEITSPSDESTFVPAETITFTGTASYGAPPYTSHSWDSDVDGDIGSGTSINVSDLSYGEHTITLNVTDTDGTTGKDMITIAVGVAVGGGALPFAQPGSSAHPAKAPAPLAGGYVALAGGAAAAAALAIVAGGWYARRRWLR